MPNFQSITFASIMRDSMTYIERYFAQIEAVAKHFKQVFIVIVEGDSTDGTKEYLAEKPNELPSNMRLNVITYDLGGEKFGSVANPTRWSKLEACWNRAIENIQPTQYVACVESDLIWNWGALQECLHHLNDYDVVFPMLYGQDHFYDTNGFRLPDGRRFNGQHPIIPDWNGVRFVRIQTGGGLIVTTYQHIRHAKWQDECRLHFPPDTHLVADTEVRIYHP